MKNWTLVLLALVMSFSSCRKDFDVTTNTGTTYEAPQIIVTASLAGQVTDENGLPVTGATVRIGNQSTTTNDFGLYRFNSIEMNAAGTYVRVNRAGFFEGSDIVYPRNGARLTHRVKLLNRTLVSSLSSNAGGLVEFDDASVLFPEAAFVSASGAPYDGEVNVYATWLDPTDEDLGDFMPGALFGVRTEGETTMMVSMGMVAVELESETGNPLQLAPGKEATITFPVPAELQDNAPEEVPMWYFDETDGVWLEEGVARLTNTGGTVTYTANVSHFTFWNVDLPVGTETVELTGCIVDENGNPLVFQSFTVTMSDGNTVIWGNTDANGYFNGPIPAGEELTFVFYGVCGNPVTFTVGPFTEDTELAECNVIPNNEIFTVTGQMVDCEGEGVANGLVVSNSFFPYQLVATDENGNFSYQYSSCYTDAHQLLGYDFDNLESTDIITVPGGQDVNLNPIAACNNPLESNMTTLLDGVMAGYLDFEFNLDTIAPNQGLPPYSALVANGVNSDGVVVRTSLIVPDFAVGTYTGDELQVGHWVVGEPFEYYDCFFPCETMELIITANGGPGGFLEGNFSGEISGFRDQMPLTRTFSGEFTVRLPE